MDTKIAAIRLILLRVPLEVPQDLPVGSWKDRQNLLVVVETTTGQRGFGEIWVNFPAWGCDDRIAVVANVIRPLLVGEPLDDPRRLYRRVVSKSAALARRWGAPGPVSHAIAGVDIALWDAFARHARIPLREAIAGRSAGQSVEVYASGIGPAPPGPIIERCAARGHTRFKLRLVQGAERDRLVLAEAREAAGDRTLMADPSETYSVESVADIWQDIVAARLGWLEEPFPVDVPGMYATYLGWPDRPPLAMGESSYGLAGIGRLMEEMQPEIVQPDITKSGGISEGIEIARLIVDSGRELVPHILGGPIGFIASANLVAGIAGARMVEMDSEPPMSFEAILGGEPAIREGRISLPDAPGLGINFDDAAVAQWVTIRA